MSSSLQYQYKSLPSQTSIRLLLLQPALDQDAPLQGNTVASDLQEHPRYEALSYVWGDVSDKVVISLDGSRLSVTRNLFAALRRLRRVSEGRLLWVDAICINQNDIEERNRQVSMMRNIYRQATQVTIWLGEKSEDCHIAFKTLRKWHVDQQRAATSLRSWGSSLIHEDELPTVQRLLSRPWFFRTWVIQEKAVNANAVILCGEDELLWSQLPINNPDARHAARRAASTQNTSLDVVDRIRYLSSYDGIRGITPGLLWYTQVCGASEPRDKVFAILGLFEPEPMPVDYNMSILEVFTRFTAELAKREGSICYLHGFGVCKHRKDLPSWVPDYVATRALGRIPPSPELTNDKPDRPDPFYPYLDLKFDDRKLSMLGFLRGSIEHVGQAMPLDEHSSLHSPKQKEIIAEWEKIACMAGRKSGWESITSMFARALHLRPGHDGNFRVWYKKYGSELLQQEEPECWQMYESSTDRSLADHVYVYVPPVAADSYAGRKFFLSATGEMGLAPAEAQTGDRIVYFPSAENPSVLHKDTGVTWLMRGDCWMPAFYRHEYCTKAFKIRPRAPVPLVDSDDIICPMYSLVRFNVR